MSNGRTSAESEPEGAPTSGRTADGSPSPPARFAVAKAMRRLSHSIVAHEVDEETLAALGRQLDTAAEEVEGAPDRINALVAAGPQLFADPSAYGWKPRSDNFPDGLVTGRANPMGFGARIRREGEEAVLTVTLGAAFEGAPGRSHGGVVATLIDETMGMVLAIVGAPAFTARLTVNYRAPTPIGVPLEVRARLVARDGRKLTITGELRSGERLIADADALFLIVRPANFFPSGEDEGTAGP